MGTFLHYPSGEVKEPSGRVTGRVGTRGYTAIINNETEVEWQMNTTSRDESFDMY